MNAVFVLLTLAIGAVAQELPTERPAGCDGSSCVGCTPFVPKPGKAIDYPCGQVDVYFPVPIYAIRNDTSPGKEIIPRQWACFACCTLGCGFDDPQNTCAYTKYEYEENGKYGCTKCKGKDTSVQGGTVKLNFEDLSTSAVYSVINQPYGACIPSTMAPPSPTTAPVVSPSPPPAAPVVSPSPPPAATVESTPPSPEDAASPSPSAEPSPEPFVPVEIGSSTTPTPAEETANSGGIFWTVSASMVLVAAAMI